MNDPVPAIAPEWAAQISGAIEPFAGDVIIKMVAMDAFPRRATA
jgi:hypothetical protein